MRFDRFELARFGRFTEHPLELPKPGDSRPDLHIVCGLNEAGKSTFRAAIGELLFGFETRTTYGFLHGYPDLLLTATVNAGGTQETLRRVKKRSHSLTDGDGSPLPDGYLQQWLGGLDKTSYARQFALDHGMLVDGGRRLLESRSDLAQLLFEAASGIAEISVLQRTMESAAGSLWKRDGRAKTAFREAARTLERAGKEKRAAVTTGASYEKLRRARDTAEAERTSARETLLRLDEERSDLERLRRIAPLFARLESLDGEIGQLSPPGTRPPRLPANAAETLRSARSLDAVLRSQIARAEEDLADLATEIESLSLDRPVLDRAGEITRLDEERARVERLPLDIDHRRRELAALERQVREEARQVGWTVASRRDAVAHLPTALDRNQLAAVLKTRTTLSERLTTRRKALAQLESDRDEQAKALATLPRGTLESGLAEAIEAARRLGDADAQRRDLEHEVTKSRRALEAHRQALAPWSGEWPTLRAAPPMRLERLDDRIREDERLAGKSEAQAAQHNEVSRKLRVAEAELATRRGQFAPVERADLEAARDHRDRLWQRIRDGEVPLAEGSSAFEARTAEADALADSRFETAEAIRETDQLARAVAKLRAEHEAARAEVQLLTADQVQRASAWSASLDKHDLGELSPPQYRDWLQCRDTALQALSHCERAELDLAVFTARCAAVAADLDKALGDQADKAATSLAKILQKAEQRLTETQRLAGERRQRQASIDNLERRITTATSEVAEAGEAWQSWNESWRDSLESCRLPAGCGPEAAEDALTRMSRLEGLLNDMERLETDRILKMQQDLETFTEAVGRLRREIDAAGEGDDPSQAVRALTTRLDDARKTESRRDDLTKRKDQRTEELSAARRRLQELRAELLPLTADANLADSLDLAALDDAVDLSDRLRALEAQREAARRELSQAAEGQSLELLRKALAESSEAERSLRFAEIASEREIAQKSSDECSERLAEARNALEAVGIGDSGGNAAVLAEEDRQGAIARMAEVAADYANAYLRAKLLRWALDRYSATVRSPLLEAASRLFARLTLGRYQDLEADLDPESPRLLARVTDGGLVGLEALSDGTRDQLYMALRLAAVSLHLEQSLPLPFIADDLLINFDDARAAAAFEVLGQLATKTQVLYLSHHEHLVDIARDALGANLNVVRL